MQINKEILKNLNPCLDRYKNYLENYPNFDGSFDEFLDLENITYNDKIWVAQRVLNTNQLIHFGLLCAESVLHIFEEKYPEDKRPRNCIEYLMKIDDFSNLTDEQKEEILKHKNAASSASSAAYAAAYASAYSYAANAANATNATNATNAAASAANATNAAASAAAYASAYSYAANAAYASVSYYAASYAANADDAKLDQQNLNIQFLKMAASL
jgi:hypothetical protein